MVLQLVQTTANLLLPTLNAAIIDDGIVGGNIPEILHLGAWMAGSPRVQVVAAIAAGYLGAVVAMELGRQLREELFAKVQSMSSQEVGAFGAASLVTRATNDVAQIQNLAVLVFTMLVAAPAIFIGGIVLAVHQDIALSGIVVAVIPVLAVIMVLIVRRLVPLYRQGQELIDRISRVLREQIIGANVIRGFVRQGHEIRRFDAANKDLTRNNLRSALLVAGMMPLIMFVVNLSSVGRGLVRRAPDPVRRHAAGRADGVHRLHPADPDRDHDGDVRLHDGTPRGSLRGTDPGGPGHGAGHHGRSRAAPAGTPAGQRRVEFRNVSFAYPGAEAPVLDGVSFTAAPGTVTAVIGATGSGKTTLLNLLPRFLDATGGEISIGGCDVRGLPLAALRSLIAVVPQHSYLFSGTVAGNLRIGGARGDGRGALAGAGRRAGRGVCPGAAAGAGITREPGRHQFFRRPAAAPVHRAGAAPAGSRLPVRRQLLGPGLRHRLPAPRRRSSRCCARPPS